jgi:hypothetical protein
MKPPHPEPATPLVDFADLYREHAGDVYRFALYLSGDTRALVEEWLRTDPELARQAEQSGRITYFIAPEVL